jgi:hypothetical protein
MLSSHLAAFENSAATSSSKSTSHLQCINILDYAKGSPEFYRIFEYAQRDQSARPIQLAWLKRHPSIANKKRKQKYRNPLSLRFVQIATDTKHREHAKKIRQGDWCALDFDDPQAIRNFYTASANSINQFAPTRHRI